MKDERGLSLLEVLIAMLFLAGAMVGFSAFLPRGRGVISHASSDRLAVEFAAGKLEEKTAAGFDNIPLGNGSPVTVTIDSHGTPSTADDLIGQYQMDVAASPVYSNKIKEVTVTLQYSVNGTPKEVRLAKFVGQ